MAAVPNTWQFYLILIHMPCTWWLNTILIHCSGCTEKLLHIEIDWDGRHPCSLLSMYNSPACTITLHAAFKFSLTVYEKKIGQRPAPKIAASLLTLYYQHLYLILIHCGGYT